MDGSSRNERASQVEGELMGRPAAGEEAYPGGAIPYDAEDAACLTDDAADEGCVEAEAETGEQGPFEVPRQLGRRGKSRVPRLVRKDATLPNKSFSPEERMLLIDTWTRSGLPGKDFSALVGVSRHSLAKWKRAFEKFGPEGLLDEKRGAPQGSRLSESTRRAILMLKENNPEFGTERISDMLYRGFSISVSAQAISNFLKEEGFELEHFASKNHTERVQHFERARPNQLWQTDLFTFMLKRQNRRVHLVAFMDDHSRFIVSHALHASASTALVVECLLAGVASYGPPEEVLTDNGPQYVTWRGKSRFSKELDKRGIKQIVATPRRPQTLGKIERFWGTLWRECVESAVFLDMGDAARRIGLFIDHYNFQRTHQGIDGLVPADRFFQAAPDVLRTLKERVDANSLELARNGLPRAPFYMTGNVGGKPFSVHAEGERVFMVSGSGSKREIDLARPPEDAGELPAPVSAGLAAVGGENEEFPPGTSPIDEGLACMEEPSRDDCSSDDNMEAGDEELG